MKKEARIDNGEKTVFKKRCWENWTATGRRMIAQLVKNPPAMRETSIQSLGWEILWRRDRLPTPVFLGFPCGSAGKESACNAGDPGSIPGLGRSPREGKGYPLRYSGLENFMDCIVHGVAKGQTRLKRLSSSSRSRSEEIGEIEICDQVVWKKVI